MQAFRSAHHRDWREFEVFTLRPSVCLECRQADIPAHTVGEAISADEAKHIYEKAFAEVTRVVEASSSAQEEGIVSLARLFKPYYWEYPD